MVDGTLGFFVGVAVSMAMVFLLATPRSETFKDTYKYIVPNGVGNAEEAFKCKSAEGKYTFLRDGQAICIFK